MKKLLATVLAMGISLGASAEIWKCSFEFFLEAKGLL